MGQPQIKSGIVDKDDGIWFQSPDIPVHLVKFLSKIRVFHDHVPEAYDSFLRPIHKLPPGDLLHLRAAGPQKLRIWNQRGDLTHQNRTMSISAGFASNEVDAGSVHGLVFPAGANGDPGKASRFADFSERGAK